MVNVSQLKRGDILKLKVDNPNMGLKEGQILRVVGTGYSKWDGYNYADTITDDGVKIEVMKNYRDFELVN